MDKQFQCPGCYQMVSYKYEQVPRQVPCPNCGSLTFIPASAEPLNLSDLIGIGAVCLGVCLGLVAGGVVLYKTLFERESEESKRVRTEVLAEIEGRRAWEAIQQKQAEEARKQVEEATAEQAQKSKRLKTEVLLPIEVQAALSLMDKENVMSTLGRPDDTSDGDMRWVYYRKVVHPITGKPDALVIQFKREIANTPRVVYFETGIGGTKYSLK